MLESFSGEALEYKKISPEEMEKRGILGRLKGIMCSTKNKTRNNRFYSKKLWDNAINDELFQEKLKNKCILAELGHPADRTEIDITQACAALAEQPKVGDDGMIYGVWDILNTPNGKILKALCDYGTRIGISSRGEGDVTDDFDGGSTVDPDTYSLETWDMVLLPALTEARLESVNESLDTKKKTLVQTLTEELNKASADDKAVMTKTLTSLNINLTEDVDEESAPKVEFKLIKDGEDQEVFDAQDLAIEKAKELDSDRVVMCKYDIEEGSMDCEVVWNKADEAGADAEVDVVEEEPEVMDEGVKLVVTAAATYVATHWDEIVQGVKDLGGAVDDVDEKIVNMIKRHQELKKEKECISENCADKEVNDADKKADLVTEGVEDNKPTDMLNELQEALKDKTSLEASIAEVQGKLAVSDAKAQELTEELMKYKQLAGKLSVKAKEAKDLSNKVSSLEESLNKKDSEISNLNESIKKTDVVTKKLNEGVSVRNTKLTKLNEELASSQNKVKSLTEELDKTKKSLAKASEDSKKLMEESQVKIEKTTNIAESYKRMANTTMKKYIESKAVMLGVSFNEIRRRLPESYSVDDVDAICEDLQSYNLNISKLPFNFKDGSRIRFTESRNDNLRIENLADEIDDQLLEMAKLG